MEIELAVEHLLEAVRELRAVGVEVRRTTIYAYGEQLAGLTFEGMEWMDGQLMVKGSQIRMENEEKRNGE